MEFKWRLGAGAAAAALLTACGPAADETPASADAGAMADHDMEAMGGEGGEGEGGEGEGGATAALDPQAKAVATLLLITGHTMAGDALYQAGETAMAKPHLRHPQIELYSEALEDLRQYGAESAAQAGDRIAELGDADAPAAEVSAAVTATFVEIDNAIANVDASVAQRAGAISAVLEAARVEFNVSITDGVVTDAAEYQDAWGFIRAVRGAFETWRPEFEMADAAAANAFSDRLAALEAVHSSPVPDGAPPSVEDFRTAVTQAQLALVPLQG